MITSVKSVTIYNKVKYKIIKQGSQNKSTYRVKVENKFADFNMLPA